MSTKLLISILIVLVGLLLSENLRTTFLESKSKETVDYVIGIPSHPANFEKREIIRRTWLSYLDHDLKTVIRPYFIIGNDLCNLTSSLKANPYDCDQVKLNESSLRSNFFVHKIIESNANSSTNIYTGFIFELNHDLTITRLGALNGVLKHLNHFTISLLDLVNQEIIAKISQTATNQTLDDYVYFDLKSPLKLNKGFIGKVLFQKTGDYDRKQLKRFQTIRDDKYNLVRIVKVNDDDRSRKLRRLTNVLIVTSFDYTFTNRTDVEIRLKELNSEQRLLKENFDRIQHQLDTESRTYNDIKFVDTVDTYRNLPDKLLKFLDYVTSKYEFKYFIKADDDTFVNLPYILESIENGNWSNKVWFGNFRKNWAVNEYGKWSESNYQATVYPPFPCGATYILSSYLVNWLSLNSKSLFRYQGEDVSMGIWLASILPDYEHDFRWICEHVRIDDHFGKDNYFSIGQLTTEEQVAMFKRRRM